MAAHPEAMRVEAPEERPLREAASADLRGNNERTKNSHHSEKTYRLCRTNIENTHNQTAAPIVPVVIAPCACPPIPDEDQFSPASSTELGPSINKATADLATISAPSAPSSMAAPNTLSKAPYQAPLDHWASTTDRFEKLGYTGRRQQRRAASSTALSKASSKASYWPILDPRMCRYESEQPIKQSKKTGEKYIVVKRK